MSNEDKLQSLINRRKKAELAGGEKRIDSQHQKGKLTARERLIKLFDENSFNEIDPFINHRSKDLGLDQNIVDGDSVITGYGKIEGKKVFAYSQDFTVLGGSLSLVAGQKIAKVLDLALKTGSPIIGINDSGGARIQEGIDSLAGYGEIFEKNTLASGVIPQISIIAGPAAGGATYSPALTDFIFMVDGIGQMYITGPDVVKSVTGEEISHNELGGATTHASKSGVSHFVASDENDCFDQVKTLLSFLPSNNSEKPQNSKYYKNTNEINDQLNNIIPKESNKPYDVLEIIEKIVDDNFFFQVQELFAPNIIIGLARISGRVVGIVANQANKLAGMLDIDASAKASRFVRFCDSFNIPIITLVDVPGFMPGTQQEYNGIIRHGAKLLYAYVEATVPKISIILRKAYGGAYIVMGSKHLRGDINYAWPSAEIAVMGPEGAVNIINRKEISNSENPEDKKNELVENYKNQFANPYIAANRGYIDDVINPSETRQKIISSLEMLENKVDSLPPKKHGNIPL
ncbi:MAG: acyl-CoA carboxylase subunit beta [Dehalococcoidia bacterium]